MTVAREMPPQVIERLEEGCLPPGDAAGLPKLKCVLIGDGAIGKTSLIVSYTTNGYPGEYVPTAYDNYSVVVTIDDRPVQLQLCDTAGQDDFDSLRPLCYPSTDVFLLCFSVVSPTSFHNVTEKWLPEIRHHSPRTPVIVVGTQCDLRNDVKVLIELANYREKPVTEKEARVISSQIGATYIECSALTQKNLKEVFDTAILSAIDQTVLSERFSEDDDRREKNRKKKLKRTQEAGLNGSKSKKGWKKFCCIL